MFLCNRSQGNAETLCSQVQNLVRTMRSVFAATQGGVKSCGLRCMEPSFALLLPSIMCFCLLPRLQSATSQLGLTFPFTAFDSLSHAGPEGHGSPIQILSTRLQRWPIATDSSSLSWFYPDEYGALRTSEKEAPSPVDCLCHFLGSPPPPPPPSPPPPHFFVFLRFEYKYISHLNGVEEKWCKLAAPDWV